MVFGRKRNEPRRAQAAGRNVSCLHCGNDHFWARGVKMSTGAEELFDIAWASAESTALICSVCGFVMQFMPDQLAIEKP